MDALIPHVEVSGIRLVADPVVLAAAASQDFATSRQLLVLFAAHVTTLNAGRDAEFRKAFNLADGAYADGISWSLLARFGGSKVQSLATTDLAPLLISDLSERLGRRVSVAVLGGAPGTGDLPSIGALAAGRLEEMLPVDVSYHAHGFQSDWAMVLSATRQVAPDVLIVGLGMPREALWIRDHREQLPDAVVITCGGWLRLLAGTERRAPSCMQRMRVEWLWRLITHPATAERYGKGMISLSAHAWRAALSRARNAR